LLAGFLLIRNAISVATGGIDTGFAASWIAQDNRASEV